MPQPPCPYCGHVPETPNATRCTECGGLFEPLSRKATQLAMGPWYVRDEARPFMPGFSEAILRAQVASGRINAETIVRGPTTNQFWMKAGQAPGLSRLLGKCHACDASVSPNDDSCGSCSADLSLPTGVDRLGLSYTDPAARQQAQAEVEAMRTGAPPPPPKPASSAAAAKPAAPKSSMLSTVDPSLLEHVDDGLGQPATNEHASEPAATPVDSREPAEYSVVGDGLGEDLWHSDEPVPVRRRPRRRGADPLVVGLGVLLIGVIGVGLFVVITGGINPVEDANNPTAGDSDAGVQPTERTADQVRSIQAMVKATHRQLNDNGVPEPFQEKLDEVAAMITLGETEMEAERYTLAYEQFDKAKSVLVPMPDEIERWMEDAEARAEAEDAQTLADMRRASAESLEAQKWSPAAWSEAEVKLGQAKTALEAGDYETGITRLNEAQALYTEALEAAKLAERATQTQRDLVNKVKSGPAEQSLRTYAAEAMERVYEQRALGVRKLSGRDFGEAEQAFEQAAEAYDQAVSLYELARYRKVYAYHAGYRAADLLIGIASGDGIDSESLDAADGFFDLLQLGSNPTARLSAGSDADYAEAAEQLVNRARELLTERHGPPVQASYHAGFQTRIIEQMLDSPAFTDEQQKRVHQCLNVFQDQAATAGWDVIKLKPVVEAVRAANRSARLGSKPEQTSEAFAVLMKPFMDLKTAARLMDPVASPSTPDDPELFPGLGSTRP